jgi:ComF family protein
MFCTECVDRLTPATWKGCPRCGGAIEIDTDNRPIQNCSLCKDSSLWFDAVVPLGSYHTGLRDVILRMKHPTHEILSLAMGRLLAHRRYQALAQWNPSMVIPVPMYWTRWLHRGANSPETISDCLASFLKIPVHRRDLIRCRNTKPQKNLKPSERFRNMAGAFGVRSNAKLQNAQVLLVDDVLTTGATCSEAAKVLKEAGATSVVVAVIARAQGIHPPKSH